jgi:hypothetical protein
MHIIRELTEDEYEMLIDENSDIEGTIYPGQLIKAAFALATGRPENVMLH